MTAVKKKKAVKTDTFTLDIEAKSTNEAFARMAVAAFVARLDPTVSELADIKTALSEAVTNSIVHGYRDSRGVGRIRIKGAIYEGGKVVLEVKDKGCGMADVELCLRPLYTGAPEEERSGMGFTVMESFCDSLRVRSAVGKGTTVVLSKRFGGGVK